MKRVFLIVLEGAGIGHLPDADIYGDVGSNTLKVCFTQKGFNMPNMKDLGLFNIEGIDYYEKSDSPLGSFARMNEKSNGKDTITGHWEIAGIISENPMPTFPDGFPDEVIQQFEKITSKDALCNKPYSDAEVLKDYGKQSMETGNIIVYTSAADSVLQVAAHEKVIPVNKLYEYCEKIREFLKGDFAAGTVIAKPFIGEYPDFKITSNRKDFFLKPPKITMLDQIEKKGLDVITIGKINDIFAEKAITHKIKIKNNSDGLTKLKKTAEQDFEGLCFANLTDVGAVCGHKNDVSGYVQALSEFDSRVKEIIDLMRREDIIIITADHGCNPAAPLTDYSREYAPMVIYGSKIKQGVNLGTRESFSDIAATILEYLKINKLVEGKSFLKEIVR
ncbi:MAG: phosphopentomutase [Oscillospiraceae bacterium]|nr:phosphopentomutase [Oscillospiraceae bacterium]